MHHVCINLATETPKINLIESDGKLSKTIIKVVLRKDGVRDYFNQLVILIKGNKLPRSDLCIDDFT